MTELVNGVKVGSLQVEYGSITATDDSNSNLQGMDFFIGRYWGG